MLFDEWKKPKCLFGILDFANQCNLSKLKLSINKTQKFRIAYILYTIGYPGSPPLRKKYEKKIRISPGFTLKRL